MEDVLNAFRPISCVGEIVQPSGTCSIEIMSSYVGGKDCGSSLATRNSMGGGKSNKFLQKGS